MNRNIYNEILGKIEQYQKSLENVGFASYEMEKLKRLPQNEESLLEALDIIFGSSKELNRILEEAPNSIFVCDEKGVCLRVNKAYEKMVHMSRHEVYGENVKELEEQGVFRPSVCWLTLKEEREVSVYQEIRDINNMIVTGVPVFDEDGNMFRVCTNAIRIDDVQPLKEYIANRTQLSEPVDGPKDIIAISERMQEVIAMADKIRDTESSVLITGETGVGKGVLAQYIHETSSRKDSKMVSINCGAIPENLLESELFGYESGAFTGADKKGKPGLIELSDGGTLFLDEISELPLMLQVKILHFLQTKKLIRVGGTKEIHIDTRVIAASNKSLEEEVSKGTFRSDLYYRINVIPIEIPPLRERKEDIEALVHHFMDYYMKKYNKFIQIDNANMNYIMSQPWPGNVRELENYVERMVVTNDSGWLLADDIKPDFSEGTVEVREDQGSNLKDVEKNMIIAAYNRYGSSYKVAEALGISQSTAYRKIKKYVDKQSDK